MNTDRPKNEAYRLRVALIRQRYTPFGGAERFVERALAALTGEGAEVTLITRSWEGAPQNGFQVLGCDPAYSRHFGGRAARDRSFAQAVRRLIEERRFDIVQSHERIPGAMIFRAGDGVHAAWLDHRARGRPAVFRWLDRCSPFHRFILRQEAEMLASPALKAVICNSTMVRDEMKTYYGVPDEKLVVIENGVDLESFHPRLAGEWRERQRRALALPAQAPVFLFVGSGFERKGVPQLLGAFRRMTNTQAHLIVVGGDKHLNRYKKQAADAGLGERVHFAGPQSDVRPYYGMADAFVLPTRYDPMPNAALEAMACGLPIVTSTTCGIASRVVAGKNGFVCDALDTDEIAEWLDHLATPGLADTMRIASRTAVQDLDLESMAAQLLALYRRLIPTAS